MIELALAFLLLLSGASVCIVAFLLALGAFAATTGER